MSVIEKIQGLFKTKSSQPEDSMDMASLGMPADPFATGIVDRASMTTAIRDVPETYDDDKGFPASRLATAEDAANIGSPDLLRLPMLGSQTIARHQRTLFILLGISVLVLAVVA